MKERASRIQVSVHKAAQEQQELGSAMGENPFQRQWVTGDIILVAMRAGKRDVEAASCEFGKLFNLDD